MGHCSGEGSGGTAGAAGPPRKPREWSQPEALHTGGGRSWYWRWAPWVPSPAAARSANGEGFGKAIVQGAAFPATHLTTEQSKGRLSFVPEL